MFSSSNVLIEQVTGPESVMLPSSFMAGISPLPHPKSPPTLLNRYTKGSKPYQSFLNIVQPMEQ
jgi:hypothetical protein